MRLDEIKTRLLWIDENIDPTRDDYQQLLDEERNLEDEKLNIEKQEKEREAEYQNRKNSLSFEQNQFRDYLYQIERMMRGRITYRRDEFERQFNDLKMLAQQFGMHEIADFLGAESHGISREIERRFGKNRHDDPYLYHDRNRYPYDDPRFINRYHGHNYANPLVDNRIMPQIPHPDDFISSIPIKIDLGGF